ncbi:MAG: NnrS family protein [Gammaproteobacteria bacterium]|nr:NnrS family protein [Gammaproteobacteria bacterium]
MALTAGMQRIVGPKTDAWPIFFPIAAVYGMVVIPISVYSMTMGRVLVPGLATPGGHAHELLFGYVLAVVAGFLLNRVPRWWLVGLVATWCLARVGSLAAPSALITDIFNVLFIVGFVWAGASRFLPTARKWRNKVFGLNLALLGLAGITGHLMFSRPVTQLAVVEAVLMISLLMMMMGGRMLAPAVAGHIERQGGVLEARVQPGVEGAIIGLLLAAAVCWVLPVDQAIAGALLVGAG